MRKSVGVDPMVLNVYLLTNSLVLQSLEMVQFAKTAISWQQWKKSVVPRIAELRKLCGGDPLLIEELENYHANCPSPAKQKGKGDRFQLPQSPIPWQSDNALLRKKYGILTRSVKKMLVRNRCCNDSLRERERDRERGCVYFSIS